MGKFQKRNVTNTNNWKISKKGNTSSKHRRAKKIKIGKIGKIRKNAKIGSWIGKIGLEKLENWIGKIGLENWIGKLDWKIGLEKLRKLREIVGNWEN